jgi:hypothetical protein
VIGSLTETVELNAVEPQAYLAATFKRIVADHLEKRIDDLMP